MKLLLLVIYNDSDTYKEMLEIQKKYIHSHVNIQVFFITFKYNQTNYVEIKDNFIYIHGEESLFCILEKTIIALDVLINVYNLYYDFIIRTNISTLINLNNLYNFLESIPKTNIYIGGYKLTTNVDNYCGLTPYRLNLYSCFNMEYISGTSIIMSYDIVKYMLNNKDLFKYEIIDDVAIGIFIRKYLPDAYTNINKYKANFTTQYNANENNQIFIRNKNFSSRKIDLENMLLFVENYKKYNNIKI